MLEARSDRPSETGRPDEARDGQAAPPARPRAREPRPDDPAKDDEAESEARRDRGDARDDAPPSARRPAFIRRHPWAVLAAFVAIVAAGIGGYLYWQHARHFEETDDAFVDARQFALAPKVGGYVRAVLVTDNQHVGAGQVVLRIEPRDYEVALDQARAQVRSAQAQVAVSAAQVRAQEAQIEQSQAQVRQSEAALAFARDENRRAQELVQRGSGTAQRAQQTASELSQREADLERSKAALEAARIQVDVVRAQRASAEASLAQAEAQVEQAELNLRYTQVAALQAGRVAKLSGSVGQLVQAGTSVATIVPDAVWVTANFKETQLKDMRPGQDATFTIDAYPDREIPGRVESIQSGSGTAFSILPAENATGNYVKVVQRVPVKIVSEAWPGDVAVGPGMSVVPKVKVR
ncbi:MAG: HlyD family secretion protein [Methylobacteriaceae bacterium]|nr:HlyD family secretion protein [Methylobacteriaceae bacterium]